ncbi:MAG TPA: glutaminyl-peptide cyclotransferase [Anaerolineae bacterium]|nr:glutaminyl-peptide cyclotransferase [Anaerolineae bacterium]
MMILIRQPFRLIRHVLTLMLVVVFVSACAPLPLLSPLKPAATSPLPTPTPPVSVLSLPAARNLTYRVMATYPHDRQAFTEGLVIDNGALYEGTGLNGRSELRRVDLNSGQVQQSVPLDQQYFGEGVTTWQDQIIQLTWQSHVGFVYDKGTFKLLKTFNYPSEGWGLTHDDQSLIMSDGTPTIHFLDPVTLQETKRITVTDQGQPIVNLNELEYVHGEILANVWQTDRIVRISPDDGHVIGWIDLSGLLSAADRQQPVDVLNGIAYDAEHDRLFVTGKLWPKLFEIALVPQT